MTRQSFRATSTNGKRIATIAIGSLLSAMFIAGWYLRIHPLAPVSPAHLHPFEPAAAARAPVSAASGIRHPIASLPLQSEGEIPLGFDDALNDLFGHPTAASLFRVDDFAYRFVATVDNLGRSAAPASFWPMVPVSGRLELSSDGQGGEVIAQANGLRYAPYVLLFERVDLDRVVQTYTSFYPALQHAYEQIGFPHQYFNDRFIDVLDQLLATPVPPEPIHVHRPIFDNSGPQPTRPWVLYQFDDPSLQSLSAGQQLLVRMGTENEMRVKARLKELRRLLAAR